jgi:glycosyltransferase involved in cell wall biosynthesis
MKTAIVYHGKFPWNRGIGRLAETLTANSHQVLILPKISDANSYKESVVIPKINIEAGPLKSAGAAHIPFNFLWRNWIVRQCSQHQVNLLIVRELPLAWAALRAGRKLQIPVLMDMRENYPAAVRAWSKKKPIHYLTRNAAFVRCYEKWALKKFDHIFVVVQQQKKRLVEMGVNPAKITINLNTPTDEFLTDADKAVDAPSTENKEPVLLYIGEMTRHRGMDEAVKAFKLALQNGVKIRMRIISEGKHLQNIKNLVDQQKLQAHVDFESYYPPAQVPYEINRSDIGIINHLPSEHTETTIPNKLFEYMALAKPVIGSDVGPIKEIIDKHQCGLTVRADNIQDIADAMAKLAQNPELCAQMGKRGRQAVYEHYTWKKQSLQLQKIINGYA